MKLGVRLKESGSWLDPECWGFLGWKLGKKLWARCEGELGTTVTLTYRRSEYSDAQDLYRKQSERQDVALFMRRLAKALGKSLKGMWICKMEFQRGGWVHFHLVILGQSHIDHAVLEKCWRRGYVWIKRLTKRRCLYMTKYVAKGGKVPFWLYGERPRSVKIVRVSPGFWPPELRRKVVKREQDLWFNGEPVLQQKIPGWVPIGMKIKRRGVLVHFKDKYFSFACELVNVFAECRRRARQRWVEGRWRYYEVPKWFAWKLIAGGVAVSERASQSEGARPRSGPLLHLRGTCNPDELSKAIRAAHWWIEAGYIDEAMQALEVDDAA